MGIIYKIVNKINGKIYIGQTKQLLKDRFNSHCHSSKGYSCKEIKLEVGERR